MKVYLGNQLINRVYSGNKELVTQNQPDAYFIDYVVVAGGGSGAAGGAGGGAGGAITGSTFITSTPSKRNPFTITIGSGGAQPITGQFSGSNGGNTYFGNPALFEFTAIGGGGGGSAGSGSGWTPGVRSGSFGGSGGGGAAGSGSRGLGVSGQGFDGGWIGNGGGGGATEVGENATSSKSGDGGTGHYIWWNKYSSGSVADGGGGGAYNILGVSANGGLAGGPSGGNGGPNQQESIAGSGSIGGGGGGGGRVTGLAPFTEYFGAAGGDGLVLIRYEGPARGIGGEIYTTGSYTVHAFTSSGIFTI
jgi:hypothetical protein